MALHRTAQPWTPHEKAAESRRLQTLCRAGRKALSWTSNTSWADLVMLRVELLDRLSSHVVGLSVGHPTRVGIDGCDAAGKTMLADSLGHAVAEAGRMVIRASIDGFHNPASVRYRRGRESGEGYFLDSFNTDALTRLLLHPLGPGGSRSYRRTLFDFRSDSRVECNSQIAPIDAVLIFDGVFLHRDDLAGCWDFSIFLDVDFGTAIRRAEARDATLFGSRSAARQRHERRYVPGQRLYFATCNPRDRASVVIRNDDPEHPTVVGGCPTIC